MCITKKELIPLEEAYSDFLGTVQSAEAHYTQVTNEALIRYWTAIGSITPESRDAVELQRTAFEQLTEQIAEVEREESTKVRNGYAKYNQKTHGIIAKLPVETLDASTNAAIVDATRITGCLVARWAVVEPAAKNKAGKGKKRG